MSQLFERVVRPLATPQTSGAFLGGLRVMAVDGTVLDVPDSIANAKVFGYPASRPGTRAHYPKVRLVMLVEAGTHLIVDALICPYRIGERVPSGSRVPYGGRPSFRTRLTGRRNCCAQLEKGCS